MGKSPPYSFIHSKFFCVDAVEGQDGVKGIVEIEDDQVSDLIGWSAERFAQLWGGSWGRSRLNQIWNQGDRTYIKYSSKGDRHKFLQK